MALTFPVIKYANFKLIKVLELTVVPKYHFINVGIKIALRN